jgi:multimeric flavodoxin WrbA
MKKVLIVAASARPRSNSTTLALKAAEGVKNAGAEAEIIQIGNMDIKPCTACDACRNSPDKKCIIEDDMQSLYGKIRESQGIIFATPVYWFNMSAQMKLFIDRTYAVHEEDTYALTGKDVAVILTYEDKDVYVSGGVNALRCFQDIFKYVHANHVGAVYGTANKQGEVQSNEKLLKEAYKLGLKVVNPK